MNDSTLSLIIKRQRMFQEMVGLNVNTIVEEERNAIAEMYVYKGIEEFVELRRTFPSVLNKAAKNQPEVNLLKVKAEYIDVLLFWINFGIVFQFTDDEILQEVLTVQDNNFTKFKEAAIAKVNHEILRSPAKVVGIGGGNLSPEYVFIGQNPAQTMKRGHTFYSDMSGSGGILLKILDALNVRDSSYFTNLVKETTEGNQVPPADMIKFWKPFLDRELEILAWGNPNMRIIPIGRTVQDELGLAGITHPSYIMRGGKNEDSYYEEIDAFLRRAI